MARGGLGSTLGAIWRLLIWGLAAVLAVAIWLAWSDRTAPPEVATPDTTETPAPAETAATGSDAPAETATTAPADTATTEPAAQAEATSEPAGVESPSTPDTTATSETPTASPDAALADAIAAISIPGETGAHALVSAALTEDGNIEITTMETAEGASTVTTRLVSCDPLMTGMVATGATAETLGARNEAPEMTAAAPDTAEARIASAACAALK